MCFTVRGVSVVEAVEDLGVDLYSSVAEEWPPASDLFATCHVDFDDTMFCIVVASAVDKFALRTDYEAASPELYAVGLSRWVGFVTYAVDCHHGQTVGHGVSTLDCGPSFALTLLLFGGV